MNIGSIQEKVSLIASYGTVDEEAAHQREDELYEEFVRYVSLEGPERLRELAQEVLKTKKLGFKRWCA